MKKVDSSPKKVSYSDFIGLAEYQLGDSYVNGVLRSVVLADRAFRLDRTDEALDIARRAGRLVGSLFKAEARKVFRHYDVHDVLKEAFHDTAYEGENPGNLVYSRRDDKALVLNSNTEHNCMAAMRFLGSLVSDLCMETGNLIALDKLGARDFTTAAEAFRKSGESVLKRLHPLDNLIVYFNGDGEDGYFSFDVERVNYLEWASQFADPSYKGNIVFIHDTDSVETLADALEEVGLLPDRCMLLAGSSGGEASVGDRFTSACMSRYLSGGIYVPDEIVTGGGELQLSPGLTLRAPSFVQTPKKVGSDLDYMLINYWPGYKFALREDCNELPYPTDKDTIRNLVRDFLNK